MISVVTGFVPIPGHSRPTKDYYMLGQRLLDAGVPLITNFDKLEDCWLYKFLDDRKLIITHSTADDPRKNTVAYHCVQHQKGEWIAKAALANPSVEVLVWIDFGIFHLGSITANVIKDFLLRVAGERQIAIPGCWPPNHLYDDRVPHWRFCGGVIIVPRYLAVPFDTAMKVECTDWLAKTGNLSWEVNTMARMEHNFYRLPIRHYYADHNHTMFTNYRRSE